MLVRLLAVFSLAQFSCTGASSPEPPVLAHLSVSPAIPQLLVGNTLPLHAEEVWPDGSTVDVTSFTTWTSSDDAIVSVSPDATLTARAAGRATIIATASGFAEQVQAEVSDAFTVVLLPDTQFYSEESNGGSFGMFVAQTKWVAENVSRYNIKAVAGLGDVVNISRETVQWDRAGAAYRELDEADIPYVVSIGNHDYNSVQGRLTTAYNRYFGPDRFAGRSWAGASAFPEGRHENSYISFVANGREYLVLTLEFFPRDEALAWAQAVLDGHPQAQAIVATHAYVYLNATRALDETPNGPATFKMAGGPSNNGEEIWEKFVRPNPQVVAVVNGHWSFAQREDLNDAGLAVPQMMSDYQLRGGSGYLRLLRFSPSRATIEVTSYSPFLDAFLHEPTHEFSVSYGVPPPSP